MEKYLPFIRKINSSIEKFNTYINTNYKINSLEENKLLDKSCFLNIEPKKWWEQQWPNQGKSGVYFIFGYQQNKKETIGVYIGKASLSSKIGNRLYTHLTNYRDADFFEMKDYKGEIFILELVSSIDLESKSLTFIAPALEEFLITDLKDKLHLINVSGNN